jgi:hypothetical protein
VFVWDFVLVLRRGLLVGDAVFGSEFGGADCNLAWRRARGLGVRHCLVRGGGLAGGVGDGADCCLACFLALRCVAAALAAYGSRDVRVCQLGCWVWW